MLGTPESGSRSKELTSGQGHYIAFLGMTLYSHSASLLPGVKIDTNILNQGCALRKMLWSPSGTQPCGLGCPEVKLGSPNKKEIKN